nr:SWIM zinc finger family protein [Pseudomonas fluorescens]
MHNALRQLLENDDWAHAFNPKALAKGFDYATEHRVSIVSQSDDLIVSLCRGSGNNAYRQEILLEGPADSASIQAYCSCPVSYNCKHCAAALYLLTEQMAQHSGAEQDDSERLSPPLENWIDRLSKADLDTEKPASGVGRIMVYELDLMPEGKAVITPYTCNRRKDGSLTDFKPVPYPDEVLRQKPRYLSEADAKLLRRVVARAGGRLYQQRTAGRHGRRRAARTSHRHRTADPGNQPATHPARPAAGLRVPLGKTAQR